MIEDVQVLLRGLSPAAQAAVIGGIAGGVVGGVFTLLGGALGLLGERWVRTWGKVRCKIEPIELWVFAGERRSTLHRLPIPPDLLPDPEAARKRASRGEDEVVRYFMNVKFFNEMETKTSLWNVVISFEAKAPFKRAMKLRGTPDMLEVVDLPSKESVTLSLIDALSLEDARKLTRCNRARLRGTFPDGGKFSERVPFTDDPPEHYARPA